MKNAAFSFIGRVDLFSRSHSRMLHRAWKLAAARGDIRAEWYGFLWNIAPPADAEPVSAGATVIRMDEWKARRSS